MFKKKNRKETLTLSLLFLIAVYIFASTTDAHIEASETDIGTIHLEGGPPVYVMDTGSSRRSDLKGAHFNIHPGVSGWHEERSLQIVSDLASHGYESLLIFIEPNDYDHPLLGQIISLSTGLGMEVIVRFNVHFHQNLSGGGWEPVANAMDYLYKNYGVEIFQPLNEVNACQDWDMSTVVPSEIEFITSSNRDACLGGSTALITPPSGIIEEIFPGWGDGMTGHHHMGRYAASELLNLLNTIYEIDASNDTYKTPDYKLVVPPIISFGPSMDEEIEYYDGFVRYFMENRLNAWDEAVGGPGDLEVLPPILTPIVTIHMYSAEGIDALCDGPQTGPLMQNVEDVVAKSTQLRAHIQDAFQGAQDENGRSIGYDMRFFVMTETGPSPDVFASACGGGYSDPEGAKTYRDMMIAWMDLYDLYCEDYTSGDGGGCIPYNFFSATMGSIVSDDPIYPSECPPGLEICADAWEVNSIYPSALCSSHERAMPEDCYLP